MGRPKKKTESVQVTMTMSPKLRDHLEKLTDSGLYGSSVADTARDLVAQRIRELLDEADILKDKIQA